jgi:heme A synthase
MSQRGFDIVKWCFWLIAFVIGAHVFAVFAALGACIYHADAIMEGKAQCDTGGRLTEILAAALAAALAFAGGHMTRNSSPSDDGEA